MPAELDNELPVDQIRGQTTKGDLPLSFLFKELTRDAAT